MAIYIFLICITTLGIANCFDTAVDLTWPFNNDTVYWNTFQSFRFTHKTESFQKQGYWYSSNEFCAGEHGGTHFDAPYHFYEKGWKVGDVPLEHLIAEGIVVDLEEEVKKLHDRAVLLPKHLEKWQEDHGPLPENCVVLVRFGWSKYYPDRPSYMGVDDQNSFNFPGLSASAAEWLARSKKVVGVGVDTASLDPGRTRDFLAHRLLSENQIYGLENVNIVSDLPSRNFKLFVMPMKIQDGSGAPVRIVAVST